MKKIHPAKRQTKPESILGVGASATEIRRQAEEIVREKAALSLKNLAALPPEEARQMLHELRVHQFELSTFYTDQSNYCSPETNLWRL